MRSPKESAQVKKKSGPTTDPTFGSEQGRVIQQRRLCEDRLGGGSGRWRARWEWALERVVGVKPKPAGKTLASRSQRNRPHDWKTDLMTRERPWNSPAWRLMMT